jgi:hypothetical protein
MKKFLPDDGRGVGAPDASRDHQGLNLRCPTLEQASITASLNAEERSGHDPCARGLRRPLLLLLRRWRAWPPVDGCGASPEPEAHGRTVPVEPVVCSGRDAGPERCLGRRAPRDRSLHSSLARREPRHQCVGPPRVRCTSRRKSRQDRWPRDTGAKRQRRKKQEKNPLSGVVYPLTTGDLPRNCSQCGSAGHPGTWGSSLLLHGRAAA